MFGELRLKKIDEQTALEQMNVLSREAFSKMGKRWVFFQKIIQDSGGGLPFLKKNNLYEQMKATKAALIFSSRNANKTYRLTYKSCLADLRRCGIDIKKFHALPEITAGKELPYFPQECDAIIISWTPMKFFLPAKQIREKGNATQRHSETLITKLYFKVVAYFLNENNWNGEQLSFYLRKIDAETPYKDILQILAPLREDLKLFTEIYQPFKFGKLGTGRGSDSEAAFDDLIEETLDDRLRTLSWHAFIYLGMENFLFHYYMTLISSTSSLGAIRHLTQIFEPALSKVIEVRDIFYGSFETDRARRRLREPYEKFEEEREGEKLTHTVKMKSGAYEAHTYNQQFVKKTGLTFELLASEVTQKTSSWKSFLENHLFSPKQVSEPEEEEGENSASPKEGDENTIENEPVPEKEKRLQDLEPEQIAASLYALTQIMNLLVKCKDYRLSAKQKILAQFKKSILVDRDIAIKWITELKSKGEKKIRLMDKKIRKYKKLKQQDTVDVLEKDVENIREEIQSRCKQIEADTQRFLEAQKIRMKTLMDEIAKEGSINPAESAKLLMELAESIRGGHDFKAEFMKFLVDEITENYNFDLEKFYKNMFYIMNPSTPEKLSLIQAVEKGGGDQAIELSLGDDEQAAFEDQIKRIREMVEEQIPGLFQMKVIFGAVTIPLEDLIEMSLTPESLSMLLKLKISAPNKVPFFLKPAVVKTLTTISALRNPVPKNNLIIPGREDAESAKLAINKSLLNRLLI